ncbi:MAG: hypothetical protein U1D33_03620, partial [bacterium]|nr:hypothetical protein [bacterium]
THLFNFVDAFRRDSNRRLIDVAPHMDLSAELKALMAGVLETLCDEKGLTPPDWCLGVEILSTPWFIAGMENLKVSAIVESPVHFRKRNIFVLNDFLKRV